VKILPALCLFLTMMPALAQADAQTDAKKALAAHQQAVQQAKARQRADAGHAALLAEQQVEAAAALRQLENQTDNDTQQLADLQSQQAAAAVKLDAAQAALAKLLPVMQQLSAQPAATLLAAPIPSSDAVRGIAILQGIAATLEAQARDVKDQSAQFASLLAQAQAAQAQLSAAVGAQQKAENALSSQIASAKADEMADSDQAARETEASAAAQRKLDSIAAAVESLVPKQSAASNLPQGRGGAPVAGHILQRFGAQTLAGPAAGVSYSAAPGARVVAPCAGTVMFAGPFPSYGRVVIADCGGGTSVVLAGMNNLDVATGQRLAHGQPVGAMLGYNPANPARQPVLYVELRQNGNPVDPTAWLAGTGQ
jgi:septal ring factor EnvC (AmiA/AmiB activator)